MIGDEISARIQEKGEEALMENAQLFPVASRIFGKADLHEDAIESMKEATTDFPNKSEAQVRMELSKSFLGWLVAREGPREDAAFGLNQLTRLVGQV